MIRHTLAQLGFTCALLVSPLKASEPAYGQRSPVTGIASTSGDWAYGCDNFAHCRAVSLGGEEEGDMSGGLRLTIDYAPLDPLALGTIYVRSSPAQECDIDPASCNFRKVAGFRQDGKDIPPIAVVELAGDRKDYTRFRVPIKVLESLRSGNTLELIDAVQDVQGTVSLRGFSEALEAFSAAYHSAANQFVSVTYSLPPKRTVALADYPMSGVRSWQSKLGCPFPLKEYSPDLRTASAIQILPLDDDRDLVLVPCGRSELDGTFFIPLIHAPGQDSTTLATFDGFEIGRVLPGVPLLPSPWIRQEDGTLRIVSVLRELGDCGSARKFVWDSDASQFLLVEASDMPSCRTASDWIVSYRRRTEIRQTSDSTEASTDD